MSKLSDLAVMRNLVEIKYRREQESFARLMIQENRLRAALKQLETQLRESRASGDTSQRAIGADVLWQAWVGRKMRDINMQLAQVLAVKERHIAQVQRAYGKVLVTDELFNGVDQDNRKKKAQSQLDRATTAGLF